MHDIAKHNSATAWSLLRTTAYAQLIYFYGRQKVTSDQRAFARPKNVQWNGNKELGFANEKAPALENMPMGMSKRPSA